MLTALALLLPSTAQVDAPPVSVPTLRVVCMGDGYVSSSSRGWPEQLEVMLSERLPGVRFEVENQGVDGDTTATALHRLRRDVLTRDPDVVVLQYGQSDAWVDLPKGEDFPRVAPGAFRSNLLDLVGTIQSTGALVVLAEPGAMVWTDELRGRFGDAPFEPRDPWGFDRLLEAYAGIVQGVGEELRVPVVAVHGADRVRGPEIMGTWRQDGVLGNAAANGWQAEQVADLMEGRMAEGSLAPRPFDEHEAPSRGWTLPEIDLAGDADRVITVDREEGQYLGHPSTEVMGDGSILCVYPKGHGKGPICMKRSTDGGKTWSERLPTPDSWATSLETPILYNVPYGPAERASRDPRSSGNVVLWSGLYPARRALSTDGGVTFGELEVPKWGSGEGEPAAPGAGPFGGIVVMGDQLRTGDSGTTAWFHDDGRFFTKDGPRFPGFRVFSTKTLDGGVSWSEPRVVTAWPHGHLCEPGAVRSKDGRIALLLRENSRRRNSQVIFSSDEGETWTTPRPLAGALTGDRHQVLTLPDGRLFISFRDMGLRSPRRGDWVAWVGTFEDLETGGEGQLRYRLMDNLKGTDCAYPALEWIPNGGASDDPVILAVTYGHWTAGQEPWIAALRLSVGEIPPPTQ